MKVRSVFTCSHASACSRSRHMILCGVECCGRGLVQYQQTPSCHAGFGDTGQSSRSAWESLRESIRRSSDLLPLTKQLAHRSSFKWEPLGIPGRHHRLSSFREASGVGTLCNPVDDFPSKEVVLHSVMGQQQNPPVCSCTTWEYAAMLTSLLSFPAGM
jgi:hypothetical protein